MDNNSSKIKERLDHLKAIILESPADIRLKEKRGFNKRWGALHAESYMP